MAESIKPPSVPSGLYRRTSGQKPQAKEEAEQKEWRRPPEPQQYASEPSPMSSFVPIILSILALLLAISAIYISMNTSRPLDASEKAELAKMAESLRSIQSSDISFSVPIKTTVSVDRSIPFSEMFPPGFSVPLQFSVPIKGNVVAVAPDSNTIVSYYIDDEIPVNISVPIDTATAFAGKSIRINKDIPIESRFTVPVNIKAAYGSELNDIIDSLDKLSK
jgi:hypothetical protein